MRDIIQEKVIPINKRKEIKIESRVENNGVDELGLILPLKTNINVKLAMARELKVMGLSEKSISRVLNVELCNLETPSTKER